jgi:hypothetical protein
VLPNFLIIGAAKCGTTTLHRQLSQHPEIFMAELKELNYFDDEHAWVYLFPKKAHGRKEISWYASQFKRGADSPVRGESSVSYTMETTAPSAARNIANLIPETKMLYILRNPFDRIKSHYTQWVWSGIIQPEMELETILASDSHGSSPESFFFREFVYSSLYHRQLSRYLEHFQKKQILILELQELKENPLDLYRKIFRFLEVDESFVPCEPNKVFNRTFEKKVLGWPLNKPSLFKLDIWGLRKKIPDPIKKRLIEMRTLKNETQVSPEISVEASKKLQEILLPDIKRLEEFLQKDLSEWTVPLTSESN